MNSAILSERRGWGVGDLTQTSNFLIGLDNAIECKEIRKSSSQWEQNNMSMTNESHQSSDSKSDEKMLASV